MKKSDCQYTQTATLRNRDMRVAGELGSGLPSEAALLGWSFFPAHPSPLEGLWAMQRGQPGNPGLNMHRALIP